MTVDQQKVGKYEHNGRQAETSHAAAVEILETSGTKRAAVYRTIEDSETGMTDEEIQSHLRMNPSTQRPRRVELVEMGMIEDSGRRRKTSSGRLAVVWAVRESGDRADGLAASRSLGPPSTDGPPEPPQTPESAGGLPGAPGSSLPFDQAHQLSVWEAA